MSWDGMYPEGLQCKRCGEVLNADGGHPAELYAGTFTGLCDKCERVPGFIKAILADGCRVWDYPPHAMAWRRDRETYFAYSGCTECDGKGRLWVYRSGARGGSYTRRCSRCSAQYHSHPERKAISRYRQWVFDAASAEYIKELKRRRILTKARRNAAPDDLVAECRAIAQAICSEGQSFIEARAAASGFYS